MKLLPLYDPKHFGLVAEWLGRKENAQWLELGSARQAVTPSLIGVMARRDAHFLRLYTSDADDAPIGIVGLSSVDPVFRTATFWGVSGDKSYRNRGYSTLAISKLMTLAFRDLKLRCVNTWAVEGNSSLRTIQRLGFRYAGRLRHSHTIDGRPYDRLLFDLLAAEHRELDERRWRRIERAAEREVAFAAH